MRECSDTYYTWKCSRDRGSLSWVVMGVLGLRSGRVGVRTLGCGSAVAAGKMERHLDMLWAEGDDDIIENFKSN